MELLSGLIGALVGSVIGAGAVVWQTRQLLQHETQQARQAATDERRAARATLTQQAARDLLDALAELVTCVKWLRNCRWLERGQLGDRAWGALEGVKQVEISAAPFTPLPVRERWATLHRLASELTKGLEAEEAMELAGGVVNKSMQDAIDEGAWPPGARTRAEQDVESYAQYVRRSLVAVVDEEDLPVEASFPPVLKRRELSVWQAPDDVPYYVE